MFPENQSVLPAESRHGQAMIELAAAIVLILIILIGMIHLGKLANMQLRLQNEARRDAGIQALASSSGGDAPEAIRDWEAGKDGHFGTADDVPVRSPVNLLSTFVIDSGDLTPADGSRLPFSILNFARSGNMGLYELGFIKREASDTLVVDSLIRSLIYAKPTVTIRETVWMPAAGGLL